MKVKTADLIDAPLDWAVAKIYQPQWSDDDCRLWVQDYEYQYSPSTIWSQGGPLLEHIKGFALKHWLESKPESCCEAHIHNYEGDWVQFGPTPLVAAMRCLVASKLGDEVDIPEELLT